MVKVHIPSQGITKVYKVSLADFQFPGTSTAADMKKKLAIKIEDLDTLAFSWNKLFLAPGQTLDQFVGSAPEPVPLALVRPPVASQTRRKPPGTLRRAKGSGPPPGTLRGQQVLEKKEVWELYPDWSEFSLAEEAWTNGRMAVVRRELELLKHRDIEKVQAWLLWKKEIKQAEKARRLKAERAAAEQRRRDEAVRVKEEERR